MQSEQNVVCDTPMMSQWRRCKEQGGDCLLLFRLGDFYEAFYEDALTLAHTLDLTLTQRQQVPMSGIPHHTADNYIDKLLSLGYKVAIAEQIQSDDGSGLMERKVVRIATPGTVISSSLVQDKQSSYIVSITKYNQLFGVACLDMTTSRFAATELCDEQKLKELLFKIDPKELLLAKKWKGREKELLPQYATNKVTYSYVDQWYFDEKSAQNKLSDHFQTHSLDGFGFKGKIHALSAAGALLSYIEEELLLPTKQITSLICLDPLTQNQMHLDDETIEHLELIDPATHSLLSLLDQTHTPMGGRKLRDLLLHPLFDKEKIEERHDAVAYFTEHVELLLQVRTLLKPIRDIERLITRIQTHLAAPKDLLILKGSLLNAREIKELLNLPSNQTPALCSLTQDPTDLIQIIQKALCDIPPDAPLPKIGDGLIFKKGYHVELDKLVKTKQEKEGWLSHYQEHLRQTLNIKTLKVGYTKAFGFYIEVSKGQQEKVPFHFHRKQTLVNAERFISNELKEFEHQILSADAHLVALETELFSRLCEQVSTKAALLQQLSKELALLDCLTCLAKVALEYRYVKPTIVCGSVFDLKEGRHPVIEKYLGDSFVPNDLYLEAKTKQLAIITGPNMAGKSTFIRQAALIAIMAQMGSFVPAKSLEFSLIDMVLTRIGARDDLARGQSTFMVEMTETAKILHQATSSSLVILDEIGRGTSTYDGISIAWAVAQYLLETQEKQPKTLFATHYFELTELANRYQRACNLTMAIEEHADEVVFLKTIRPGFADKSYGIHVAALAGLPQEVIAKARKKLLELEKPTPVTKASAKKLTPTLFTSHPILCEIQELDPQTITPLQALELIFSWKKNVSL